MRRGEAIRFAVSAVALLAVRAMLLWLFIPAALLLWPLAALVAAARRRGGVSPRTCLRFADDLLTAGLANLVFRPLLGPYPWPWQPGGRGSGGTPLRDLW